MPVESALVVGKVVGQSAGRLWLAGRAAEAERGKELVELIRVRFPDRIMRRRVERQLDDIADSVAERLLALCGHEYRGLGDGDKAAALAEVAAVLRDADLSDEALFAADTDPVKLARRIRNRLPGRDVGLQLGEAGARLYDVVLDECCDCLVRIVRQLPQFGPRAAAEMLSRLSGLADQVAVVLARLPARSLDAPTGTADDAEFKRRYLGYVSETLDTLELFGVSVGYRPRTTLSVAYISLSVSADEGASVLSRRWPPREPAIGIAEWREREGEREAHPATVGVETALGRARLIFIRGEAGSGKSTLLRWLAITAARGAFTADLAAWNGHTPFLIRLRSRAGSQLPQPEQFIGDTAGPIAGLMPEGWVHRQLSSGQALLFVDGVDELPSGQRRVVRPWLAGIIAAYPQIRVVVTSRPAAAAADWLTAEGFAAAFLERMSPADVRALIRHWHDAVRDSGGLPCPPERLPVCEAALLARLEAAPSLRALAASPLLAAMLCALNLDRDTQLPRDRMGLYGAALDMLLERRDAERQIPSFHEITLEREQKLQILQDLAWRLSVTGRTELPTTAALRRVEEKLASMPRVSAAPGAVLSHLLQRSGVLREPVPGRVDFVHRTVQEYLTAKQLADDGDMEPLVANAHRDQWQETVVMAAGHANAPLRQELLAGLLKRVQAEPRRARRLKLLVAACLETLPTVPPALADGIEKSVDDLIPPRDITAARSLATAGDSVLERLPRTLDGLSVPAARATVRTAWLINGPKALDVLTRYAHDHRYEIQHELIDAWKYFDPDEYATHVLADAPCLDDGWLTVETPGQLRAARRMRRLQKLEVKLEVADLTFLHGMPALNGLYAFRLRSGDLTPLLTHAKNVATVYIRASEPAGDITPITNLPKLQHLDLTVPCLRDLTFVQELPQLKSLWLGALEKITDFSPLTAQQCLTSLGLRKCPGLSDITKLPPLGDLNTLMIQDSALQCGLDRLAAAAPRVTSLYLFHSAWVSDLSPLSKLALRNLTLWKCEAVDDLAPLAALNHLTQLNLDGIAVRDLSPLSGLANLETLFLTDCIHVHDLAPLAKLPKLRFLDIANIAPGTDLAPLARNRKLKIYISLRQDVRNRERLGRRVCVSFEDYL